MNVASYEQIFSLIVKFFWHLLKEHATLLITLWASAATAFGLFLIRKLLQGKAKPNVTDAQIRIDPCDLPPFRFFTGSLVVVNDGHKRCNLTGVQLLHESLNFEISDITDLRQKDLTAPDRGTVGVQLPLSIRGNEKKKIFFFGFHQVGTLKELPETLSLEVTFNCRREPFLYGMVREPDTKTYGLCLPEQNPPR